MPMTKGKLSLLLLAVALVAVLLSGCFLPKAADKTGPVITAPDQISATAGQQFTFNVSANDDSGVKFIRASFMGQVATATTSPASFTFTAPDNLVQPTTYPLDIVAVDNSENHNSTSKTINVNVWPTQSGTITTSVQLNNVNGLYMYPVGPQENGSVIFSVKILSGANLVKHVNVFVDGQSVPSTSTVSMLKASASATSVEAEYTFFYAITAEHAGPHSYYAEFYNQNGDLLQRSPTGWFYILYPAAQKVELSDATPLHNVSYITGDVSFTATATDYTSNYEAFIIKDNATTVLVNYPSTNILKTLSATKIVKKVYTFDVNTASMTDGSYTFEFLDRSVDGAVASDAHTYVVDNTPPVLKASYKGEVASNGEKLYVGISPSQFDVYMKDVNIDSYDATIMNASQKLPVTLSNEATVPVYVGNIAPSDGDTATFTAWAKDKADHKSTLTLTVVRDLVNPKIISATITGLATVGGVPYSAKATITVEASVTDKNLKSVALMLDGPSYTFQLTQDASTGLWTGTINLADEGVLPGTYKASIIATDLALNEATAATVPATVNVYREATNGIFTTSLETTPSTPVNGFVKSATITVNINPDWVYAINKVYLYKGTTVATSQAGNATSTYYFTSFTGTGTYHVVVEDNVAATTTQAEPAWTVKIDSTAPSALSISPNATAVKGSPEFTVKATDTESGVAYFELQYKDPDSTWVTIDSTSGNNLKEATFTWYNLQTLLDGEYELKLIAKDGVGNEAVATTTVINDSMGAPSVTFTPAATLIFTKNATQTVGFTVSNEGDIYATLTFFKPDSTVASQTYQPTSTHPYVASWKYPFDTPNATYTYKATVTDEAGHEATHTTLFVYDTMPASFSVDSSLPATIEGGATVTITIHATDNLSGIKSVTVNGQAAKLSASSTLSGVYDVASGTYVATFTAPDISKVATYSIVVYDNAGNEATAARAIYVDATAPKITVKFAGTGVTPAVDIISGHTYTVYASETAAATLTITATDDSESTVTLYATVGTWASSSTVISPTIISTTLNEATYTVTAWATDAFGHMATFDVATVTVVIDATAPTATLLVPSTLNLSNFDTAVATYTATDEHFYSATLTINGHAKAVAQTSTPTGVALNNSVFELAGLSGATVTATLTVYDKAGNSTTVTKQFYVDTVSPEIHMTGTIYKTTVGGSPAYAVDVNFGDKMRQPTTALASTDFQFYQDGTLWYNIDAGAGVSYDPNTGFLHIYNLLTPAGSVVSVAALADHTFTVKAATSVFVSAGGNPVSPNSTSVTFSIPYGSPNPNNK
ncbi:Ig-like domain repeat protein [Mesoaciditoga lauensis]|uniref:DUF7743 domain-containing protein n=1 Tax=Mesoaciditoga lauensis TaxID=1495039 RepID=UPI0005681FB1|nr:Ig-like domain repeat protein [Mesoaciditoga lauensis]